MTLQQKAYSLIDTLPDDSVRIMIQVMEKMIQHEHAPSFDDTRRTDTASPKQQAYSRMQELRRESMMYDITAAERAIAMDARFGKLSREDATP